MSGPGRGSPDPATAGSRYCARGAIRNDKTAMKGAARRVRPDEYILAVLSPERPDVHLRRRAVASAGRGHRRRRRGRARRHRRRRGEREAHHDRPAGLPTDQHELEEIVGEVNDGGRNDGDRDGKEEGEGRHQKRAEPEARYWDGYDLLAEMLWRDVSESGS